MQRWCNYFHCPTEILPLLDIPSRLLAEGFINLTTESLSRESYNTEMLAQTFDHERDMPGNVFREALNYISIPFRPIDFDGLGNSFNSLSFNSRTIRIFTVFGSFNWSRNLISLQLQSSSYKVLIFGHCIITKKFGLNLTTSRIRQSRVWQPKNCLQKPPHENF